MPGSGGAFASVGAIAGPLIMLVTVLRQPGPVKTLRRAGATAPDRARKATTLAIADAPLRPLLRSGVVVREADGRIWLDEAKARRRQWRIGALLGLSAVALGAIVAFAVSMGHHHAAN
ncbi:MAG: hypothetical protein RL136_1928 [Planctomycetota bacterium]